MLFASFLYLSLTLFALAYLYRYIKSNQDQNPTRTHEAVIITGCDSGIGLELAKHLFKSTQYTVICCFLNLTNSDGHAKLSSLMGADEDPESKRLCLLELDITSERGTTTFVDKIDELLEDGRIKRIVALINNAGVLTYGEFDWLTWNHIQTQIDVNLIGTIRLTRAMVPYIIKSKGRIINVSSVNDSTVFPGLSIYSATKSAISTFSRGLGYELRKFGAHVVTVRLGDFARLTNIMSSHAAKQDTMWSEMSLKKREMYGDFFKEFNQHLLDNYGMTSPPEFAQSSLFRDFDRALLARNPPNTITCAPLGFKVFYYVIELTPVWIQYHLLDLLFQFGFQWKPPRVE